MEKKKLSPLYKLIKWTVRLVYPKMDVEGAENIPSEPCVIVGNHAQMNGPIASELYSPVRRYTWCAGEMTDIRTVPEYAFRDFWSRKPRGIRALYRILSYLIAPLSVLIFRNADCISVYHDARMLSTFRETVARLGEGASVVIFPEHDVPHNHIIYDFQDRFIDLAKLYYRKTGKALSFVPLYIAPGLRKMCYCRPVSFDPGAPPDEERRRICRYIMETISETAESLPLHTVVPYRNIPKKNYNKNKISENEKTGS